jgi:hypothetical protein
MTIFRTSPLLKNDRNLIEDVHLSFGMDKVNLHLNHKLQVERKSIKLRMLDCLGILLFSLREVELKGICG